MHQAPRGLVETTELVYYPCGIKKGMLMFTMDLGGLILGGDDPAAALANKCLSVSSRQVETPINFWQINPTIFSRSFQKQ